MSEYLTKEQIATAINVIQTLMTDDLNKELFHSFADVNIVLEWIAGNVDYEELLTSPNQMAITENIDYLGWIRETIE